MLKSILPYVWFTILSCALAYIFLVAGGKIAFARASGETDPVLIRDELGPGSHHLYGMLLVKSTCDQLKQRMQRIDEFRYKIIFETWEDPSVPCKKEPTPRAFHDVVFAPAVGIEFIATYDDAPFPIAVLPSVNH